MSEAPRLIRHTWLDGKQFISHADDVTCDRCTPPPTREPIRLTAEAEAAYHREFQGPTLDPVLAEREKECFVAGFRAARTEKA